MNFEWWQMLAILAAAFFGTILGNWVENRYLVKSEEGDQEPILDANGLPEDRTELDKRIGDYA